jgi:hypothetical protein
MIPNNRIKHNIAESVPALLEQGNYPYAIIHKKEYTLDNFTDGIFLSQNYRIDPKEPVRSAMLMPIAVWSWDLPETLQQQVEGTDLRYRDYPRYWNGNTLLLRPLLLLSHYSNIRWIMYAVSSLLLFLLFAKLYQKTGLKKMLAFAAGLICVNIFVMQFSLQFFSVAVLGIIGSILVCYNHESNPKSVPLIIFIIGCLTSYFDMLSTPLITLGLPLIVFLMLRKETSLKEGFKELILYSAIWVIGFACTWASKWLIGTLLTDVNVFADAYENMGLHTGSEVPSRIDVIIQNIDLLPAAFLYPVLGFLFLLSVFFFNKKGIKNSILLLFLSIYPIAWYFVLSGHSSIHYWFTYRSLAIFVICILLIFINLISWEKIKSKIPAKILNSFMQNIEK